MVPIGFHLGLRQVVMALMNWAIDVPLELNKVMQYPLSPRLMEEYVPPSPPALLTRKGKLCGRRGSGLTDA